MSLKTNFYFDFALILIQHCFRPPTNGSTACRPQEAYLVPKAHSVQTEGSTLAVFWGMSLKTCNKIGGQLKKITSFRPPQAQRSAYLVSGNEFKNAQSNDLIIGMVFSVFVPHKRSEVPTWFRGMSLKTKILSSKGTREYRKRFSSPFGE